MAGDKIKLNVDLVKKYSNKLNTASENLGSVCTEMYNSITGIKDQSFKSQIAEAEYYNNIEDLNKKVPIFRDGVLKFSQFLLSQVIDTYGKGDEEIKEKLQNELDETIKQLATIGMIGGAAVDLTKISSTAQGALQAASSGEGWIESSKINTEAFTDTGNLEFVTRDDGSIMITRNGVPIGFTTEEGIIKNESTASEAVVATESNTSSDSAEKYMSQSEYETLPEMQKQIVDKEGYKVVSDSEYVKMSQGTGQNKADSYDARISSESQAQVERVNASQAIAQNEISTRQEKLEKYEDTKQELWDTVLHDSDANFAERGKAAFKLGAGYLSGVDSKIANEISDIESGKILDLNPYLEQRADIPITNAIKFNKPGLGKLNDLSLNNIEKLVFNDKIGKYQAIDKNGNYQKDYSLEYLSDVSIDYKN